MKNVLPKSSSPVIFYLALQAAILFILLRYNVGQYFYWYCYHIPLLYGIAFWAKKPQIVLGLLHVGIVVQLFWIIDLFAHFFGLSITHQTDFIFGPSHDPFQIIIISLLTHFAVPILTILWTYKIAPQWKSLAFSAIYIPFIYLATLFFSHIDMDLNCVFERCADIVPSWHYIILWPIYLFIIAFMTFGIHLWLYKLAVRKKV